MHNHDVMTRKANKVESLTPTVAPILITLDEIFIYPVNGLPNPKKYWERFWKDNSSNNYVWIGSPIWPTNQVEQYFTICSKLLLSNNWNKKFRNFKQYFLKKVRDAILNDELENLVAIPGPAHWSNAALMSARWWAFCLLIDESNFNKENIVNVSLTIIFFLTTRA